MGKIWLGFSIVGLIAGLYGVITNISIMGVDFFIYLLFVAFCVGEVLREFGYIQNL